MTIDIPEPDVDRRLARARAVILGSLVAALLTSFVMPGIGLVYETDPLWSVLGGVGIVVFVCAQAGALYSVVTPALGGRRSKWLVVAFGAAAVASVPLVGPVGAPGWTSWAWLGGSIAGSVPLLLPLRPAAAAVAATFAVAAGVAWWNDSSIVGYWLITASVGLVVAAMGGLPVWLWQLLVQAQEGRAAMGRLAASQERLRFARDVHDLLGHSLSVIALKAELANRLAAVDPERAGQEAADVQRLAASALAEVREAVHGYRAVDLTEQLQAFVKVLRSSGVRCTVEAPAGEVPAEVASLFVPVLREATTNMLRHSRAEWCTIELAMTGDEVRLTVTNDGVTETAPDRRSSGLHGLADRLADAGGTLRTEASDGVFTLSATAPTPA